MVPNNARIVTCPHCGAKKELMSLRSSNNIGAQYWSDLKMIAPMWPKISPVQKCLECGEYFLEYKQEGMRGEKNSFETGKLSYWEWKEAYGQLCSEGVADINAEDLVNIRGWLVQSYNDHFYRGLGVADPPKEEYDFIVGVMNALIKSMDWSETLDPLFPGGVSFGDAAQEKLIWSSKQSPLLKAELYREMGEFYKCTEILRSLSGKKTTEFDAYFYYCVKEWMDKGEVKVFKIYDEQEADKSNFKKK